MKTPSSSISSYNIMTQTTQKPAKTNENIKRAFISSDPWEKISDVIITSLDGESPTYFRKDTCMPYWGFEPEPTRFRAECYNHYTSCQVIYSQFGLAIHQNDHQARRRFVEWAQNEIAVVPDFHKRILFSDEAHFWLNGYVNKQNCRIWSEANPQVYVETPLHPEKLTVWCALWAGGILLQKR
ncbi:hypothetical protein TNCV_1431041 [Trichonephila clavipes]|nr:hypothetical protein TNCV_1431041 [Trichonephila clavipes]